MKRIIATTLFAAVMFAPGCSNDNVGDELDELNERLDGIEKKLAAAPAARGPAKRQRPQRPDPNTVYAVPIDGSPWEGAEHAPVTIVKAYEFACPFCLRAKDTVDQILEKYEGKVKVVYKSFVVHPQTATTPALAVCAADKQGKFSEMKEIVWEKGFKSRTFDADHMKKLAAEIGLDADEFAADLEGEDCKEQLESDRKVLAKLGTRGTPNFYINGRPLSGAQPLANFEKIIDQELEKAETALEQGAEVDRYYAEHVLEKGKKAI